jgi:hypothetical protein
MKKLFAVLLLFFQMNTFGYALDLELNHWYDFKGDLEGKPMQLSIFTLKGGKLIGSYCSFSNEPKVPLSGNISGNEIFLTESKNGKITAEFIGKIFTDDQDRMNLTRRNIITDKKSMFHSVLMSSNAGTAAKRYTHLLGSDQALESFIVTLKKAIANNDKIWITDHIFYPLKVRISEKSTLDIKNRNQLLLQYDKIFTLALKLKISSTFSFNLFNNYQGVMLGDGQIWVNNGVNGTEKNPGFQMISINP